MTSTAHPTGSYPIHRIPFTPENTPGFVTFSEAYRCWARKTPGLRAATPWEHWHLLNLFQSDDNAAAAAHPPCPHCSLPTDNETCSSCQRGRWLFT